METEKKYKIGHHHRMDPTLNGSKREAASIAKDLCYSRDVIDDIWDAESVMEIDRILATARQNMR